MLSNALLIRRRIRKIYCCGITPDGNVHLGHVRTLLVSLWVKKVVSKFNHTELGINWTDIDGKLLNYISLNKTNIKRYGKVQVLRVRNELKRFINFQYIDYEPCVSNYISQIIEDIDLLKRKDLTFQEADGYYLKSCKHTLKGFTTKGGFAVWKKDLRGLETTLGKGLPGWHLECSTMIKRIFDQVDLHLGGRDLIFPHHVNEDLLHKLINGKKVSLTWKHIGLVNVAGQKMSKSLKNYFLIKNFKDPINVNVYLSFFKLSKDINFTWESFSQVIARFNSILRRIGEDAWSQINLTLRDYWNFWKVGLSWSEYFETLDPKRSLRVLASIGIIPIKLIDRRRLESIKNLIALRKRLRSRKDLRLSDRLREIAYKEWNTIIIDLEDGRSIFYLKLNF